jgi:hypothetical protein
MGIEDGDEIDGQIFQAGLPIVLLYSLNSFARRAALLKVRDLSKAIR